MAKEEQFKWREERLRKNDLELQEALVLFNKFLKENEQKRRHAERKTDQEREKRLAMEAEIINCQNKQMELNETLKQKTHLCKLCTSLQQSGILRCLFMLCRFAYWN